MTHESWVKKASLSLGCGSIREGQGVRGLRETCTLVLVVLLKALNEWGRLSDDCSQISCKQFLNGVVIRCHFKFNRGLIVILCFEIIFIYNTMK